MHLEKGQYCVFVDTTGGMCQKAGWNFVWEGLSGEGCTFWNVKAHTTHSEWPSNAPRDSWISEWHALTPWNRKYQVILKIISGQYPKIGEFKKWNFSVFCMLMSFGNKLSHSIGDDKNVKTCQQCMSLTEKTEFHFFFISLSSGIAFFQTEPAQDARVQIQMQTLRCCLHPVWTLPFTSKGSSCSRCECTSCVD